MAAPDDAIRRHAERCASLLPAGASTFDADRAAFAEALDALTAAVRAAHDRFAFDLDGRPGALAAIRGALPALEAQLLDAVIEDVACELAARQEALYRVAVACRTREG
jgi:hypothetical protein